MAAVPLFQLLLQPVLHWGEFVPAGPVELFSGIGVQFEQIVGAVGIAFDELVLPGAHHAQVAVFAVTGIVPSVAAAAVEQMGVAGAGIVAALVQCDACPVTDGAEGVVMIDAALADLPGVNQAPGRGSSGGRGLKFRTYSEVGCCCLCPRSRFALLNSHDPMCR